jgi:peptidoglycan/LPS O-acetylase OafA/YrhL
VQPESNDPPGAAPRLLFLDNLRAFVIVMVVVLHASITYMAFGPEWWYVVDPDQSLAFTALVLLVDVPNMPALFFVAGFFAIPSLARRGLRGFVREKTIRLAIPWLFAVVFLAPLATYMIYVSRDVPTGYLEFWTRDFWGPLYQQSVYWFLGVLFVLFLLLAGLYDARPGEAAIAPHPTRPPVRFFVAFAALTALGSMLLAPRYSVDDWQPLWVVLVVQPARIALYVGYFALGIHAQRRGWFRADGYRPEPGPWGIACVVAGLAYLVIRIAMPPETEAGRIAGAMLFGPFCLTAVMYGLAAFGRWGDGAGRAWRTLADNSFGVYYVHPLILYPLAYLFVGLAIPSVGKAAILVTVTLAASLVVSALVLRRLPGLRRIF